MKKHQVIALVGTLALLANLLVPGLAFGQVPQAQSGTADIGCDGDVSYNVTPAATFAFSSDGAGAPIYTSNAISYAYNNSAATLDSAADQDYIQVNDTRPTGDPACNDGLTLTVGPVDQADADGIYFDPSPLVNDPASPSLPLDRLRTATAAEQECPGTATEINSVCIQAGTICGKGNGASPDTCTDEPAAVVNVGVDDVALWASYTAIVAPNILGTAPNTPASVEILSFADESQLYGSAGVPVVYGLQIPANPTQGVYQVNLVYTLTGL